MRKISIYCLYTFALTHTHSNTSYTQHVRTKDCHIHIIYFAIHIDCWWAWHKTSNRFQFTTNIDTYMRVHDEKIIKPCVKITIIDWTFYILMWLSCGLCVQYAKLYSILSSVCTQIKWISMEICIFCWLLAKSSSRSTQFSVCVCFLSSSSLLFISIECAIVTEPNQIKPMECKLIAIHRSNERAGIAIDDAEIDLI